MNNAYVNSTVFSTKPGCLDDYGRVTLPKEIREKMQLDELQKFKISCDGTTVYLKKVLPHCDFCDSEEAQYTIGKKHYCNKCLSQLKNAFEPADSYQKYSGFIKDTSHTPIETTKLSSWTKNALIRHGYSSLEDVCKETPESLIEQVGGLGKKRMRELFSYIEKVGLSFKK